MNDEENQEFLDICLWLKIADKVFKESHLKQEEKNSKKQFQEILGQIQQVYQTQKLNELMEDE